jgi:GT2 family glycosyltransferase
MPLPPPSAARRGPSPTSASVDATVIVVSFRPGNWLAPALASVRDQARQVLLIDNGSADRQASEIGRRAGVTVIRSPRNLGFSLAVNHGLRVASGELVALLNDDAMADPHWLAASAEVLNDPLVAAVQPKAVLASWYGEIVLDDDAWYAPPDPRPLGRRLFDARVDGHDVLDALVGVGVNRVEYEDGQRWRWSAGRSPFYVPLPDDQANWTVTLNGEPVALRSVCRLLNTVGGFVRSDGVGGDVGADTPDDGRFDYPAERFYACGVALVARRETWQRVGPFASRYFTYYEDVDWSWRARLQGYTVLTDPTVSVLHHRSATSGGAQSPRVRVLSERNRTLTMVRNGPWRLAQAAIEDRRAGSGGPGVWDEVRRWLPWALTTRATMSSRWALRPEEVWARWGGAGVAWPRQPNGAEPEPPSVIPE